MRQKQQSDIRQEEMLEEACVCDTTQKSDNAYLQNFPVTEQVGPCSMPKVLKKEDASGVAGYIQYPKIDRVFSSALLSGLDVESDLASRESGEGPSTSGHRAPSSPTRSSIFVNMLEVPVGKHTLASICVEQEAGILVEVKDEEKCIRSLGGGPAVFLDGPLSPTRVCVEGQKFPKLETCCLDHTPVHSDCLEDMLKEGLFFRMASHMGTGKVMANSSLFPEVEADMSSQPVSDDFSPNQNQGTVKETDTLPILRKLFVRSEKTQIMEEVRSCILSAGDGSIDKTVEVEPATDTDSKVLVTPKFPDPMHCCAMGITQISDVTDGHSFDCIIEDAEPLFEDASLKESDKPSTQCRESGGGESVTETVGRAESEQNMGVEEVPLSMSECTMQPDTNGCFDGEIVAGTSRAFLEWDGEDPVCAFEETEMSSTFSEGDYMEEEERTLTQLPDGEEEGTFAQSPSGAKMAYYKSSIPIKDVKKNGNWIEETSQTNKLFMPYAANLFKKPVKPSVYVDKDVPGQACLKKKIKKKKPVTVKEHSETSSQFVAQVRETCLNSLVDILLKRVNECEDVIVHESTVKKVAQNVERELFTLYLCTDVHYKKKYRTLIFNLGDSKNKQLFRQVVLGEITPQFLVKMSPTELASEELKEFRESESKHIISRIENEERNVKTWQVTKMTHKGLIEIDTDMDQMLSLEDMDIGALNRNMGTEKVKDRVHWSHSVTKKAEISFEPDCFIVTELKPHSLPKTKSTSKKKIDDVLRRLQIQDAETVHISNVEMNMSSNERAGPLRNLHQKPTQNTELWTGCLKMFSLKIFGVKAFHVSGYDTSLCQALPEVIESQSCILPEAVWEYVDKIWPAESKHMGIFRFNPNNTKDAQAYTQLYTYLSRKQRYGIMNSEIMEGYIVPVAAYQHIPAKLHPLGGPGLEECHQNLLLAVILPKRKPTNILRINRRPDPSRKRKVSFEDSAGRYARPPSPNLDSWGSPGNHQTTSPEVTPDYLETILNHLEEVQREDPGASNLGVVQPSIAPFVQQEECLGGDLREALGSGVVDLLQLITQNIPLMQEPCGVPAGTSTSQPNLVGIPLISTGPPWGSYLFSGIPSQYSSMGLSPNGLLAPQLFSGIPSQYSSMGLGPNGLLAPHVYQPTSLSEQYLPTQVSAQTCPLLYQPSEVYAAAPQCTVENGGVQAVLEAVLQGLQNPGLLLPFVQGCDSVQLQVAPMQQPDGPFAQPAKFPCV